MTTMQMSDLHNFAKAEVAKRGLGVMPKDGLKPKIYRKRPPICEAWNRVTNEKAQAAKDGAAVRSVKGWMRDMALAKPDDESQ
jgi:hypothetical protein